MELCKLENEIAECNRCFRLREWSQTRQGKSGKYKNEEYWGLPVPGFGDHDARILVVGLAPGAHGANRTGRPFTGDIAGDILFKVLYKHGFSNSSQSSDRNDGLILKDVYITNAVCCAPPDNKPNSNEFKLCREYLSKEIKLMKNLQVILTLGKDAFNQVKRILKDLGVDTQGMKFRHRGVYGCIEDSPLLVSSYHTSKYNIHTKRMSEEKLDTIFNDIENLLFHIDIDPYCIIQYPWQLRDVH